MQKADQGGTEKKMRRTVKTNGAPQPKGPYSQGIDTDGWIFVSGQGPVDPKTGEFKTGTIEEETHLTLTNIKAILEGGGGGLADVVKCSVFLRNLDDFEKMNKVYCEFFPEAPPARTTVGANLLAGIKVEIDVVAKRS